MIRRIIQQIIGENNIVFIDEAHRQKMGMPSLSCMQE
jgi:hypothetical protein